MVSFLYCCNIMAWPLFNGWPRLYKFTKNSVSLKSWVSEVWLCGCDHCMEPAMLAKTIASQEQLPRKLSLPLSFICGQEIPHRTAWFQNLGISKVLWLPFQFLAGYQGEMKIERRFTYLSRFYKTVAGDILPPPPQDAEQDGDSHRQPLSTLASRIPHLILGTYSCSKVYMWLHWNVVDLCANFDAPGAKVVR